MYRLVQSFEAIALNLVDQDDFTSLEIVGNDITIKAERVCIVLLLVTSMPTIPSSFLSVICSVVDIYLQPPAQIIKRNGLVFNPINITGEHSYSFLYKQGQP